MADKILNTGNTWIGRDFLPMTDQEKQICMKQKTAMANLLWMQYFNSVLYEKGLITEVERNRMKVKIDNRYGNIQIPPISPDLYISHRANAMLE